MRVIEVAPHIIEAIDAPSYDPYVEYVDRASVDYIPELHEADIPEEVPTFSETCCDNQGRAL